MKIENNNFDLNTILKKIYSLGYANLLIESGPILLKSFLNNNLINDFYLFSFAKHFIVSPSSFHWWGAWLNQNPNKICVRPSANLNPSNNKDFWPETWSII